MVGARIFITIVFIVLGATFIASTVLLIYEFQVIDATVPGAGWLTMVIAHGHLFLFFPILGVLALVAFHLPSVVLTHLYWNHVPYGKLRFLVGFAAVAGLACLFAWHLDRGELRSIYEASPTALLADKTAADEGRVQGRVAILDALANLRGEAQKRFGLSSFGRSCKQDKLLEEPEEMKNERYCFPAAKNLRGYSCCEAQKAFAEAVRNLQKGEETRSLSGTWDRLLFLPVKTFFILVVVIIAVMLAIWRSRMDRLYGDLVPRLERGVIIGGFAMLFWLAMDYGYQQTANALFGRPDPGPQLRLSLVLVPWALLLLFYFLRRLGKQGELLGQISGVVFAGVAVARYEQLNDWIVRLVGIGAAPWMLAVLIAVALIGLVALFWLRRVGIYYGSRPAVSA
jgi:hypothetical protein